MKAPSFTFAGGVLGEGLYGRVDLNKYQTGLKVCHNAHIAVEGGAEKRFGTYYVGHPKFDNPNETRLLSWRIANDDSYMLVFGHQYVRFIRFGGFVSIPGGHTPLPGNMASNVDGVMELALPYTGPEVRQLRVTFANDIVYIFHPNHAPRELRRLGLYDWQLVTMNFDPHPVGPTNFAGTWVDDLKNDDNYDPEPIPIEYMISATMSNGVETKPTGPLSVNGDLGHRRLKIVLTWDALPGAVQYTIYKGQNGIFGFIGYTEDLTYTDRNFAPSYSVVPIGDPIPFPPGEWPRVGEFYKQRLVMAAPPSEPQGLWLSRPLTLNSLTTSIPSQDDDAIKVTLVGRERHTIHYLLELKKFIIFTSTAEWVLGTFEGQPMAPGSIDPTKETAYGIDPDLAPLPIGERILFVQGVTGDIRDLGYEFTSDAYRADDLSRLARHIFLNRKITAWTYGAFPQNLLHCVTDDGALRSMTYVREHEIWGWSTSATAGLYEDVAAVPEIDHDGVYFIIQRTIGGVTKLFIERTEINFNGRIEDMVYVDAALTYKEPYPFHTLTRVSDSVIEFTCPGAPFVIGDEVSVELFHTDEKSREILDREYRVEIVAQAGDLYQGELFRRGDTVDPTFPSTIGRVLRCVTSVGGFQHLVGLPEVWVLADGKVLKDLVIDSNGDIDLPFSACRVHAGIPYTCEVETLDLDVEGNAGAYTMRAVDDITLRLRNSRGVWAGASESPRELVLLEGRNLEGYYEPNVALDGPFVIPAHAAWSLSCGVRVESRDPLPLNVLNIVPSIVYGT